MRKNILPILLLLGTIWVPEIGSAEDAEEIIRRMDEKYTTESGSSEIVMLVYPDADDPENVRTFEIISHSRGDEETYMEFLSPRTIKGLTILSRGDDQWAYFPSTGRVRKIAAASKKESVRGVGGDFSYEDLGGTSFEEKYRFSVKSSDEKSWILEGIPKIDDAVYSRILITIDRAAYLPEMIVFFTEEEGRYKELVLGDVKRMGGRQLPTRMSMKNIRKNSMTVIITKRAKYGIDLPDKYFNPTRFYK